MTSVAVCALTLRRPVGIARLLSSIAAQEIPDGIDVKVVVVDNDADRSAEAFITELASAYPFPLHYVHEPRRGIPYGRNTAVAASGDVDFIAFLDDDEYAPPTWLGELLRVQAAHRADVVEGPALPDYEDGVPSWVIRGRFFERPRYETGAVRPSATTSNVLFARHVHDIGPFAEWMGLTGGDDTHFFTRARLEGCKIVWADDATVHEVIPVSRANARWLVRRQFRRGTTLSHCLRDLEDSPSRRVLRMGRAGIHVLEAIALLGTAVVHGRIGLVASAQRFALAAGIVAGLWNIQYREYEVVHGT